MYAIWKHGSDAQKDEWLPRMATGEAIGCFGLTEPDFGSDPGGMRTRARRDGDDWVLSGNKMWITNGSVADVAVVWARTVEDGEGRTADPRLRRPHRHRRDSPRPRSSRRCRCGRRSPASWCWTTYGCRPTRCCRRREGLSGPLSCLTEARFGIVYGALGRGPRLPRDDDRLHPRAGDLRPAAGRLPADPGQAGRHGRRARQGHAARAAPRDGSRTRAGCRPRRSASAS